MKQVTSAIAKCDRMELFEGLPTPSSRQEAFESERLKQNSFEIGAEWFYVDPIRPSDADVKNLKELLGNPKAFPATEPKACVFHSDWCLRVYVESDVFDWKVCFSCIELKVVGPVSTNIPHVEDATFTALKSILVSYRKNCPVAKNNAQSND